MGSVPVPLSHMDDDLYITTPEEEYTIRALRHAIYAIQTGNMNAVGFCCVNGRGRSTFFYYNKPDEGVMDSALSRLVGVYSNRTQLKPTNAPIENRSYEVH